MAPRAVLVENVPGLVSFENGATLHAILDSLTNLGYGADVRILGAAYYGVPQMRWRTIILGLRGKNLPQSAFPEPVFDAPIRPNFTTTFAGKSLIKKPSPETSAKFVTVYDGIGDLPSLANGEQGEIIKQYSAEPNSNYQKRARTGSIGVINHEAPRLSEVNMRRLKYIKPGGNWTNIPNELLPKGMRKARKSDHTKRYGRVDPSGLASTILTKCDPHWGAYFHYEQDRAFTVREAARLQSFPDHFVFMGTQAQQFAQVGNAVPPLLANAIGATLKSVLSEGA
jgi:DNA (cytosine-5)-methyltransferase 1